MMMMRRRRRMRRDMGGTKRPRRQINETSRRGGCGGRGGRGRGRGRGGRGRGGGKRTRDDSTFITLTDRKQVKYHPSFQISSKVYAQMKQSDKELMYQQREEYKRQHNSRSSISTTSTIPQATPVEQQQSANQSAAAQAQISQVSQGSTMMGGRNEQTPR